MTSSEERPYKDPEAVKQIQEYAPDAKYKPLGAWRYVGYSIRLADAQSLIDLYDRAGRTGITIETRDNFLEYMGFFSTRAAKDKLDNRTENLNQMRTDNSVRCISASDKFNIYPIDDLEKELGRKLQLHETIERSKPVEPTTTTPAPRQAIATDPNVTKLAKLMNAPYVDAKAIDLLLPLLTLTPENRTDSHHEILQTVANLTQMMLKLNKDKDDSLLSDMRDLGRGSGQRSLRKHWKRVEGIDWKNPNSQVSDIKAMADLWAVDSLMLQHMISSLPEAQRKAVQDSIKHGVL